MPLEIDTAHGPARAHVHEVQDPVAVLFLGHGAGGGVGSPDLLATTDAARAARVSVVLVEQPYRVAGRRSPAPAPQLDAAWRTVVEAVDDVRGLPRIAGGRSSGARVACRTAADTGAIAVICLAFPVHPPGRPEKTRLHELDAVTVPTLVVQGDADPFGMPPPGPNREVVVVPGTHSLRNRGAVAAAIEPWLSVHVDAG